MLTPFAKLSKTNLQTDILPNSAAEMLQNIGVLTTRLQSQTVCTPIEWAILLKHDKVTKCVKILDFGTLRGFLGLIRVAGKCIKRQFPTG